MTEVVIGNKSREWTCDVSLRKLFRGWATLMPPVGGETWRGLPIIIWAPNRGKKKIKWCPKIDFDPTFDREPGHEESIGDVCFQF